MARAYRIALVLRNQRAVKRPKFTSCLLRIASSRRLVVTSVRSSGLGVVEGRHRRRSRGLLRVLMGDRLVGRRFCSRCW